MKQFSIIIAVFLVFAGLAVADEVSVTMYLTADTGTGQAIGTISVKDTPYGALFTPDLSGLSPGLHGFHLHENPACGSREKDGKMVPGLAAGGAMIPPGPADTRALTATGTSVICPRFMRMAKAERPFSYWLPGWLWPTSRAGAS